MSIASIGPAAKPPERLPADPAPVAAARTSAPAAPVESNSAAQKAAFAPTKQQVDEAVANINKSLQTLSQDLEFSVDEDSNRTVVKVIDQKTKEVIRQMPTPEALEIAKALDKVKGLLIKQTA